MLFKTFDLVIKFGKYYKNIQSTDKIWKKIQSSEKFDIRSSDHFLFIFIEISLEADEMLNLSYFDNNLGLFLTAV